LLPGHHSTAVKIVPKIWNNIPIFFMKLPQKLNDFEIKVGKRDGEGDKRELRLSSVSAALTFCPLPHFADLTQLVFPPSLLVAYS